MSIPDHLLEASKAIDVEDYAKAIAILEPLCEQHDADALGMLGVFYQLGLGVPVDGPKALELLSAAVEGGSGIAAHNLGTIYVTGLPGVAPDLKKSRLYYRTAKQLGAQIAPDSFYE